MTAKETEALLNRFRDMPEQEAQLCRETERLQRALAAAAGSPPEDFFKKEIQTKAEQLARLHRLQSAITAELEKLPRLSFRLIELAYLGPKDPRQRERWLRRPTWYSIAAELKLSEVYARRNGKRLLNDLAGALTAQGVEFP